MSNKLIGAIQDFLPKRILLVFLVLVSAFIIGIMLPSSPLNVFVIFGGIIIVILCFKNPILSYYLIIILMPFRSVFWGSPNYSPVRIVGLFAILVWFTHKVITRRIQIFDKDEISKLFYGLLILAIAGLLFAGDKTSAVSMIDSLILLVGLYLMTISYINDANKIKTVCTIFIISFCIMTIISLLEYGGYFSFFTSLQTTRDLRLDYTRYSGLLGNPNRYALNALFAFAATFYVLITAKSKTSRFFAIISFIIISWGALLSQSRAGVLAMLIFMIMFGLMNKQKVLYFGGLALAAAVFIVFLFHVSNPRLNFDESMYSARLSKEEFYADPRIWIIRDSFEVFLHKPILGVGIGNIRHEKRKLGLRPSPPHNIFVSILLEYGVVGFTIFMALLFLFYRRHIKLYSYLQRNPQLTRYFVVNSFLLSIVTAMLAGFSMFHNSIYDKTFWICFALSPVMLKLLKSEEKTLQDRKMDSQSIPVK